MQTENRLFDDLARVANGAINTLSGVREEIENRLRERVERWLADMDLVPREEFEATREMAQKARSEQEELAAKVADLERKLSTLSAASAKPAKAAAKPASRARKTAAKPATRGRTTKAKPADQG